MTLGFALGKFYPPHLGHVALVEHAASLCDELVVMIAGAQTESIALDDRRAWLAEAVAHVPSARVVAIRDDAPVDYHREIAWVAHVATIEAGLAAHGFGIPDVVVTSEAYGEELARRWRARSEVFDVARAAVPVSATLIRSDLVAGWSMLPEATRRGLATRVVVVGAESTGTTTLADDLAAHYRDHGHPGLAAVPEYGREFTYLLHAEQAQRAEAEGLPAPRMEDLVWLPEHFARIARRQTELEDAAALVDPLVVADTDALATMVWERRYLGDGVLASADAGGPALPRRDLYLVTDHVDVPFDDDGWRDGEHLRADMTEWFTTALTERGASWILLRGDRATRLAYAVEAIDAIVARRTRFDSPPWD